MPTEPTDQWPEGIATYVLYEWDMFCRAGRLIPLVRPLEGPALNAVLESFLLHTRILVDFFFPDRPRHSVHDGDVLVKHFLPTWDKNFEECCPYINGELERLSKALAHLTYDRIGYEPSKEWDCQKIFKELQDIWRCFWDQLSEDQRGWFFAPRLQ